MTHTPGPWLREGNTIYSLMHAGWRKGVEQFKNSFYCHVYGDKELSHEEIEANARLIAAAPDQHAEMVRYLPVLERAESDPELWDRLTAGLGIATLNGYRAAISKATNA